MGAWQPSPLLLPLELPEDGNDTANAFPVVVSAVVNPYEALKGYTQIYGWELEYQVIEVETGSLSSLLYIMKKSS